MSPEHVTSFVTYYLQNLSERTRREKSGTKWGIDWIAYNIGLARFGKPVRLPFLRHGHQGFPTSKVEAEFGVDLAFVSDDGLDLRIFVLKDEPLTNRTWITNNFDSDLRMAIAPDLDSAGLERVATVTVILAYNKDDQQNGVELYERFTGSAPSKLRDTVVLCFERWNLSELAIQTIAHVLSPSIVPERFFGQLSYLAAQIADFRHGSDRWEHQLIPNWRRFIDDVLAETVGTRGPELIPVALIVLREHASVNPSHETGWIDLIEWAAIALWKADITMTDAPFHRTVTRFWAEFYLPELERFYRAHIDALAIEHSIDQLAHATSVGAIAAAQIALWHVARLGILSVAVAARADAGDTDSALLLKKIGNWLVALVNANEGALRPLLDIEHIQLFVMFETLRNADRLEDFGKLVYALEMNLFLRRLNDNGLPFLHDGNSLDDVLEQVATRPAQPLVTARSSFFILALLEMCCALAESSRDDLLSRIHRHLVLGAVDVGEPGDRTPLDLISWIPPQDWTRRVLEGSEVGGEGVAVHRFGDTRDLKGTEIFERIRQVVRQIREVDPFCIPTVPPLAALILSALKHRSPLPPELWRRTAFSEPFDPASTAGREREHPAESSVEPQSDVHTGPSVGGSAP